MVEVVSKRGVHFRWLQVRVLPSDLISGPSMREVIHRDLSHTNAGQTLQPGGLVSRLLDVRIF